MPLLPPENGNAGYDLYADISGLYGMYIRPGKSAIVHTGIAVELPQGMVGFVMGRSGLAFKENVRPFYIGVIDHSYRGEIKVLMESTEETYRIYHGDRIAQLVVVPCFTGLTEEVEFLSDTLRGDNGFGSSGK